MKDRGNLGSLVAMAFLFLGFGGINVCVAGEFPAKNVTLRSWIDLTTFDAANGSDCWGYVSPSGREYAIIGLYNKAAFVEVTDPSNPIWFASVPHVDILWNDMKVYDDHAYIVTEENTGVQVVDMSDIDNHVITLVNTITPPLESHNIALDTFSGFLYSSGGYMFDLADPANPAPLGQWNAGSQHDMQAVTYVEGPNAGRQIIFGCAGGSGLDIIDVTDKTGTFLVSRTTYPNLSYAHQAWTEDFVHLYLNDEGDGINRTTVFDITDLSNPVVVGQYDNGTSATDHNQYVHNGFIFEADYRSGMRIFDANVDPIDPPQIGWFDTYPADDAGGFDGAWSVFPYFPSGTVIVSDISRGLFVLDVSEALGFELQLPEGFEVVRGRNVTGNLADILQSDGAYLQVDAGITLMPGEPPVWIELDATGPGDTPASMTFRLETSVDTPGATQTIELFNYVTDDYEQVDQRTATSTDSVVDVDLQGDLARFIEPGTRAMRAQLTWHPPMLVLHYPWRVAVDQAIWSNSP